MSGDITESKSYYDFLAWLEIHRKQILTGAAIAAILAVAVSYSLWHKNQREAEATAALLKLGLPASGVDQAPPPTAKAYFAVAEDYSSTSAGMRARLMGAGALFADGKYGEAQAEFQQFQNRYAGSPLCATAAFGMATCLDAINKVDDAVKAYQDVISRFPENAVIPQAKLALARLHESKSHPELALKLYEEVSRASMRTYWGAEANEARTVLLAKFPQLAPTNTPTSLSPFTPGTLSTNVKATPAPAAATLKTSTNALLVKPPTAQPAGTNSKR